VSRVYEHAGSYQETNAACFGAGKTANCQTLVSLTLARGEVPVMLALRLFLPESCPQRRQHACVDFVCLDVSMCVAMHPETKHGSVEDKRRDDTRRIQSRQNGETGTDRVTKDTVRSREKVSSGANFIFAFSDAMS
jgi:hypothetical protein